MHLEFFYEIIVNGNQNLLESLGLFQGDLNFNDVSDLGEFTNIFTTFFIREKGQNNLLYTSLYGKHIWRLDSCKTLDYGMRLDVRNFNSINISPRANLKIRYNRQQEFSLAVGFFVQDNFPFYVYAINPNVVPEKSIQLNAEWSYNLSKYFRFEWQNYYKYYYDLVIPKLSSTNRISNTLVDLLPEELRELISGDVDSNAISTLPVIVQNQIFEIIGEKTLTYKTQGTGYILGTEFSLFFDPKPYWRGWLSFELLTSQRNDLEGALPYRFGKFRPWSVNLVNYFDMPGNHIITLRWKYAAGQPYTNYNFDTQSIGTRNGSQYIPYNRFDFRLSKQSTIFGTPIVYYFEVWNAFNSPNFLLIDNETNDIKFFNFSVPIPFLFLGIEWQL